MRWRFAILFAAGLLPAVLPAEAQERTAPRRVLNGLALSRYDVAIVATEELATVVVEETFANRGAAIGEADFLFPLPAGTRPSGLQLQMNGRFHGGNLLTRAKANDIYNRITRTNRDPAIIDCIGKDLYRCRVFPVPGNGTASIRFAYRQPLIAQGTMRKLVVPLDAARFNRSPVEAFSLSIELRTEAGLQAIACPTHEVDIVRTSAHRAVVTLEAKRAYLARDLVLLYSVDDAPLGAVMASYRRPGDRGYFVLSIDAAFAQEEQARAPRDVVLAIDTSNSAGRESVDATAAAVADAVGSLGARDRFALVAFSTDAKVLSEWQRPDEMDGDAVRALIAQHPIAGRTHLASALRTTAKVAASGLAGAGIVLLTDGLDTEPTADSAALAREIAAQGHRVGVCGVGRTVDTVRIDELGDRGEGDSVYPDSKLSDAVKHLFATTRAVPLSDVAVEIEGVSSLYPEAMRLVRAGDTILVAGRYARHGDTTVRVSGLVGGKRVARTFTVRLRERGGDPAIARLWAARRIGHLLDDERRNGARHREEIVRLGRRHGIVTPYTSLLVLERDDQQRFLKGMRRRPLLQSAGGTLTNRRSFTRAKTTVDLARRIKELKRCKSGAADPFDDLLGANRLRVRRAAGTTFYRLEHGWVAADMVDAEPVAPRTVKFLSEAWFRLVETHATLAPVLALGTNVLFRLPDGTPVRVEE